MSERYDDRDAEWPLRPWIMAAICAVAGLSFENLSDVDPTGTLLDLLRYRLRRIGTKEGCAEGDCTTSASTPCWRYFPLR